MRMNPVPRAEFHIRPGGVLSLSGSGLKDLLKAVMARNRPFRFRAGGSSMAPFIKDGDVVTLSPLRERRLRPGDPVAFCSNETGMLIVHRIVRKRPEGFLVRGDNAAHPDGTVPAADILGWVTRIERRGRKVRLGRSPERRAVAFLSRIGILRPLVFRARRLLRRGNDKRTPSA
jgi:signal peptidase I